MLEDLRVLGMAEVLVEVSKELLSLISFTLGGLLGERETLLLGGVLTDDGSIPLPTS